MLIPSKTSRHGISVVIPIAKNLYELLKERKEESTSDYILPGHQLALPELNLYDKGYNFHSWRHTFRTRLSEAGVSDDIAKRLGGWTDDKTVQRYDHAERIDELRAAIESSEG